MSQMTTLGTILHSLVGCLLDRDIMMVQGSVVDHCKLSAIDNGITHSKTKAPFLHLNR